MLGAAAQMVVIGGVLYFFLERNYNLLLKYSALDPEITALLYRELNLMIGLIGGTFFLYLVGISVLGVLFSHRVAGVITAVKRTMGEIVEGKDSALKLRTKDEFQELADEFNAMVDYLRHTSSGQKAS